ncbi:MAG TPA: hypothetical protein VNT01_02075 [Symbiobacteriaceae bacterium]|nr:hypothetical protein [Symbiobacteriaceae bacterium]
MDLPASLREINPVIDAIARGEPPVDGPALRLAVALGLATPGSGLTEAGRAYARPALAAGPASLVMSPDRRRTAEVLVGGPLPLQASLRRLLRAVIARSEPLVAPPALGWPEALIRPYLAYLEDLGLLVPIGPLVEATPRGRLVAAQSDPPAQWPRLCMGDGETHHLPHVRSAVFRYHLVRRVCLGLVARRGRREWHLLQPLLDGPLAPLVPAYNEWLARFLAAQPVVRRSWPVELVQEFEAGLPAPSWFPAWCQTLLGVGPEGALDALAAAPGLLREPPVLADEPLARETWLVAAAIGRAASQGWSLKYAEAAGRLAMDGIILGPWAEMHRALEAAGLLVTDQPEVRLLLPVHVLPEAAALWPYAGPDWLAAALLEGGAFNMASHGRRTTVRV